jgi:hypothetical protein
LLVDASVSPYDWMLWQGVAKQIVFVENNVPPVLGA